jgi:hypothetical protein
MMATCRGAAAQLSQVGERGREQGARPRSRYPPFDKRRHATCTRRAHSCSNLPKCGVFCMLSLGELPRVPDRSTGGTGGARCTTVRASGPYLRYGYRRFAPYHVLVHSAHPYRVGPGSGEIIIPTKCEFSLRAWGLDYGLNVSVSFVRFAFVLSWVDISVLPPCRQRFNMTSNLACGT